MLYDSLNRRWIVASMFCLLFSSSLFSQQYSTDRTTVAKRTIPAFRPPQSPARSNTSKAGVARKKSELLLEPIIIYYPRRPEQSSKALSPAAEKTTVELIKPITIYYRVWTPTARPSTAEASTARQQRPRLSTAEVKSTVSSTARVPESKPVAAVSSRREEPARTAAVSSPLPKPASADLSEVTIAPRPVLVEKEKPAPIDPPKPKDETPKVTEVSSEFAESKTVSVNTEKPAEELASSAVARDQSDTTTTVGDESSRPAEAEPAPVATPSALTAEMIAPNTAAAAATDKTVPALAEKLGSDAVTLNNAAVNLSLSSQYEEAEQLLLRAIQAFPDNYKFYRNLSIVYEGMKKFDQALAAAEKAAELAPHENSVLMQLCGSKLLVGKEADAVVCYEKVIEAVPEDIVAQTFFGVALLRSGKPGKAIPVLEKVSRITPPNSATLNALGVAYFETKRFTDAVASFKSAVEADPDRCEIRFNLAVAQFTVGNREGAISQYRILKEADPKLAGDLFEMLFRDKVLRADRH